jgi:WD40 repeat protein
VSSGLIVDEASDHPRTALEQSGQKYATDAPVTIVVTLGELVAAGFGDGVVRFFRPEAPPIVVSAHRGAVLALSVDHETGWVLSGGDDGRFLRISAEGSVEEIASFGSRWVDCVASGPGWRACSSGRLVLVWRAGQAGALSLEHPSTVGGLDFDSKGARLAVGHYGGTTVWKWHKRRWESTKLFWKGSHGAVTFSPDGRFLVSTMQENALHGWRLRDRVDMRMAGYPAKVKSQAWTGSAPFLATSGTGAAVLWPFDGPDGPMGRTPITCAHGGGPMCTTVAGVPGVDAVFAGFKDGSVLVGMLIDGVTTDKLIKGVGAAEVTAIAVTPKAWLFVGDAAGEVLWVNLKGSSRVG